MHTNPYAAPQPPPPGEGIGVAQGPLGEPLQWDVGEILNQAWALFKPSWAPLVGAFFIMAFIGAIPRTIINLAAQQQGFTFQDNAYWAFVIAGVVVGMLVQAFFQAGFTKMLLTTARGHAPNFGDLFGGGRHYFPMLAVLFLSTLATFAGASLFCLPGLLVYGLFMLAPWFVVDRGMGPLSALGASVRATRGQRGKTFLFVLSLVLVIVAGYFACCIGVLAALPLTSLAIGLVYLRGTGQASFDPTATPPG